MTLAAPAARKLALAWAGTEGEPAIDTLRIAFATDDRVRVNQHFGAAAGFAVYAVDADRARLVEVCEYSGANDTMDGNEDKLACRIAALAGCAAVYCLAVGASAVRQLLACGVQPVRVDGECAIETLLTTLRQAIANGGVPWIDRRLRRAAGGDGGDRFERMAQEGWQE